MSGSPCTLWPLICQALGSETRGAVGQWGLSAFRVRTLSRPVALSAAPGRACVRGHGGGIWLAGFPVLLQRSFRGRAREHAPLLDQAYRLRYQVYCVENNYEDPHQADGRETDIYDERAIHALLMHRRTETVAGTVRVILPRANDQEPSLPINIVADSEQRELLRRLPHSRTAEISRFSVAKAFRQRCTEAEDAIYHHRAHSGRA